VRVVVDASVALGWVLADENTAFPQSVLEAVLARGAIVPAIWPSELANGLLSAVRRKRIAVESVPKALALLEALLIEIEVQGAGLSVRRLFETGVNSGLTAYDAAYLDLCVREGLPLATQDADLQRAARKAGVSIFTASAKA